MLLIAKPRERISLKIVQAISCFSPWRYMLRKKNRETWMSHCGYTRAGNLLTETLLRHKFLELHGPKVPACKSHPSECNTPFNCWCRRATEGLVMMQHYRPQHTHSTAPYDFALSVLGVLAGRAEKKSALLGVTTATAIVVNCTPTRRLIHSLIFIKCLASTEPEQRGIRGKERDLYLLPPPRQLAPSRTGRQ